MFFLNTSIFSKLNELVDSISTALMKPKASVRGSRTSALCAVLALAALLTSTSHATTGPLEIVSNPNVCMVTDTVFPKKQIPVTFEGKTYYGCCQNCKATLSNNPQARKAIDPVTGKTVDKAVAVIAAQEDGSVIYFENKKNFEKYLARMMKR